MVTEISSMIKNEERLEARMIMQAKLLEYKKRWKKTTGRFVKLLT